MDPDQPCETTTVRLIEVQADIQYSYVTLSHRWGRPEPPKLSASDSTDEKRWIPIQKLQGGISISDLPRLFQNAIQIVRSCGFQYLWIDSLCVLQDTDSPGQNPDWAIEAEKMGDIYAGGILYAATSFPSPLFPNRCFRTLALLLYGYNQKQLI